MADGLPLNALLAQVLIAETADFEERGAGTDALPSIALWADVLRCIGEGGVDVADLPELGRISTRAGRTAAGNIVKRGWATAESDSGWLRLTDQGQQARDAWHALIADVDGGWCDRAPAVRSSLVELVGQFELELPHYPTGYGTADDSIAGGPYVATHGVDWRPVRRGGGDTVSDLPLFALLSQALVMFALEYEARVVGALAHAALALRLLTDSGVPIGGIPLLAKLPGNGKSALERHHFIVIVPDPADPKVKLARPTARGQHVRDNYAATVAAIEDEWRSGHGDEVVSPLRSSLEAVTAGLDPDLPHHVTGLLHRS
jgi:hypothetical protein